MGIDLTEAMLDIAKRHNTYNNVSFKLADAAQMRFADDQFDVSSVSLTLHEMPSLVRECVLSETVRVTALDGIIMIVEYVIPRRMRGTLSSFVSHDGERANTSLNLSHLIFEVYSTRSVFRSKGRCQF